MAQSQPKEAGLEATLLATRQSLEKLAEHWEARADGGPLVVELRALLSAAEALTEESFAWGRSVGLQLMPPAGAIRGCQVAPTNLPRDGLPTLFRAELRAEPPHPALLVAPAPGCGFGVFATAAIKKGTQLGEYTGEVCRYNLWNAEVLAKKRRSRGPTAGNVPFIPDELYAAWAGDGQNGEGAVVDAFAYGNAMRFVNCSCRPNVSFKFFGGVGLEGYKRLRVVALRDLQAWEQLSVDYGWYHDVATNTDVKAEALAAYKADRESLSALLRQAAAPSTTSVALRAVSAVLAGKADLGRGNPDTYLQRFVSLPRLQQLAGQELPRAGVLEDVPGALRRLYTTVGATRVGIVCMCGLDPSLNLPGKCSGIIGLDPSEASD